MDIKIAVYGVELTAPLTTMIMRAFNPINVSFHYVESSTFEEFWQECLKQKIKLIYIPNAGLVPTKGYYAHGMRYITFLCSSVREIQEPPELVYREIEL